MNRSALVSGLFVLAGSIYWLSVASLNLAQTVPSVTPTATPSPNPTASPTEVAPVEEPPKPKPKPKPKLTYRDYMRLGYQYSEKRDYQTALINFRRALKDRPGDPLAAKAVANMQKSIRILKREQMAEDMKPDLDAAVKARDWNCALKITDRMLTLLEPTSTRRAELVVYRGRLQGIMNSEASRPSTVCQAMRG